MAKENKRRRRRRPLAGRHILTLGALALLGLSGYELWIRVDGKEDVLGLIGRIKDRIGFFEVRMGTMDEMFINIVGEEGKNP